MGERMTRTWRAAAFEIALLEAGVSRVEAQALGHGVAGLGGVQRFRPTTSVRALVVAALAVVGLIADPRHAESQVIGYGIFGPTVLSGGSEYLVSGTTAGGAEFLFNGRIG